MASMSLGRRTERILTTSAMEASRLCSWSVQLGLGFLMVSSYDDQDWQKWSGLVEGRLLSNFFIRINLLSFITHNPNRIQIQMSVLDHQDITEAIVNYLNTHDLGKVSETILLEIRNKYQMKKFKPFTKGVELPRLLALKRSNYSLNRREVNLDRQLRNNTKKFKQIVGASKSVFQVTISLVQMLSNFKESNKSEIAEMIETYKIQLAKYYKVVENEGKPEGQEPTEVVFFEHKNKLDRFVAEKNIDGICEVLLSFRVNALQIAPELRKNLVYQLIRNDLFKIEETEKFDFLLSLLDHNSPKLRYAIIPLVSIVCSTLRGVEYITSRKNMVVINRIIKILKEQENGSVIQRFCLALLQKCSVKETVIPTFLEYDMIKWLMNLINKSLTEKIHHFSLDFGSALLANIIHAPSTLAFLSADAKQAQHLMESMLRLLKMTNLQVSILMHLLICLSYLSKEQYFKVQKQNCSFVEKISQFVQYYSQINTSQNEAAEIDKRTVLDLCAHMFHPKDVDLDNSQSMEYNELKTEDRIREYQNQQGELIFECFQDEV